MSTQPQELVWAAKLEYEAESPFETVKYSTARVAAAELRRLHEVNQELLEALQSVVEFMGADFDDLPMASKARAAIAKATGEQT